MYCPSQLFLLSPGSELGLFFIDYELLSVITFLDCDNEMVRKGYINLSAQDPKLYPMYLLWNHSVESFHRSSLCRHYSSSGVRRGIGRYVGTKLQRLNTKYERFLKMRFPRFFQLYHTFVEGSCKRLCTVEIVQRDSGSC